MGEVIVRELWCYPVKSCQGVSVASLDITHSGIVGDRQFALWEQSGDLVEQKLNPNTASIAVQLFADQGVLELSHAAHGVFRHKVRSAGTPLPTKWILDEFESVDQGDEVADWLSVVLGKQVRLVSPGAPWLINLPHPRLARMHGVQKQQFYSASQVSIANQASLDELNTRVDHPIPMDRFRVNIIVDGIGPYAEDEMEVLANDNVELLLVSPAERCVIIATDQQTGARPSNNVLKILGDTRRRADQEKYGSGLLFGNYMTVSRGGIVSVGDRLSLQAARC